MSKYDFKLDMNTQNSNSIILKNIKPKSLVLEIGCAHGRMTKYLKETLECTIDIAEIDEEAGKVAAEWAQFSFLGKDGNVEDPEFWEKPYTTYDYIIFADVLEHLVDPAKVLSAAKKVLAENGSIWISVPNVAYNGIIIELINDQFTYRETGLMDNTHLRWFTINSLDKMVKKCGYKIVNEQNLINYMRNSEFKDAYTKVPPQIASFLKFRPSGEVYQMVWELKIDG
jgi:O-antigen biosynthesis protein